MVKTLKDIVDTYGGRHIGDTEALSKTTMSSEEVMECVHILNHVWTDLRQSAIEWIREIEIGDGDSIPNYDITKDEDNTITFIKHFFGITDEEVKAIVII